LEKIYLLGIISILKVLTNSSEEIIDILKEFDNVKIRKEFHNKSTKYTYFVEKILKEDFEGFINSNDLLEKYYYRKNKLIQFNDTFQKEYNINNLKYKEIILSISHMFCNRMIGNIDFEARILSIAYLLIDKYFKQLQFKK
jgi:hypothetical protein